MNDFESDGLWIGIREFRMDEPAAQFPYSVRLAKENYWPKAYAELVIGEYKKFCYLGMIAGHPVAPSDPVDQAWHLHILFIGTGCSTSLCLALALARVALRSKSSILKICRNPLLGFEILFQQK